ncbi:MAG: NAD/NADP octopine/nopaline dehydrogenase family protein [Alphaproteobacteria bacterium]
MAAPVKNIAIFGAGGGGTSAAAHLTTLGFEIRLYSQDESALAPLQEIGGIEYNAPFGKGFTKIPVITSDAATAMAGAELVMIVSPAHLHEKWISAAAPHLTDDQTLFVSPGHTLMLIPHILRANGIKNPVFCETATCRISRVSDFMVFGGFPGKETKRQFEVVSTVYPAVKEFSNVLETVFPYGNAIHHPPAFLCNAGRVEATGGNFRHYYDGITPSVGRLIDAVDRERVAVANALNAKTMPFVELFYQMGYTTEAARASGIAYEAFHQSEPDKWIPAPPQLEHRYFLEDVPYGHIIYSELGRLAGVPTPTIDHIIHLASVSLGRDLTADALTLEKMGLAGVTKERFLDLLENGFDD